MFKKIISNILILLLVLAVSVPAARDTSFAADSTISALDASTSMGDSDLLLLSYYIGGTYLSRKITYANFKSAFQAADDELAAIAALTNGAGGLSNDGAGVFSYVAFITRADLWSGVISDEQLLCGENTDGTNRVKSCGAKVTDSSTASHYLYKSAAGAIVDVTLGTGLVDTAGTLSIGTLNQDTTGLTAANVPAPTTIVSSGNISVTTKNTYVICTNTCAVTPLAPAAGVQLYVRNAPGSATAITLVNMGAGKYYELTDHSAWATANQKLVSAAGATAAIALVGYDADHYATLNSTLVWTDTAP